MGTITWKSGVATLPAWDCSEKFIRQALELPTGPIRYIVCSGPRRWGGTQAAVQAAVDRFPQDAVVVTGGAEGADRMWENAALRRQLRTIRIEPIWNLGGQQDRAAGHKRNRAMLALGPVLVAACLPLASSSKREVLALVTSATQTDRLQCKGTAGCVREALARQLHLFVVTLPSNPSPTPPPPLGYELDAAQLPGKEAPKPHIDTFIPVHAGPKRQREHQPTATCTCPTCVRHANGERPRHLVDHWDTDYKPSRPNSVRQSEAPRF